MGLFSKKPQDRDTAIAKKLGLSVKQYRKIHDDAVKQGGLSPAELKRLDDEARKRSASYVKTAKDEPATTDQYLNVQLKRFGISSDELNAMRKRDKRSSDYDLALRILERRGAGEFRRGDYGLYRNTLYAMAAVCSAADNHKQSAVYYICVCMYDISGLVNGNMVDPNRAFLAPGVIRELKSEIVKGRLGDGSIYASFRRFRHWKRPPVKIDDKVFKDSLLKAL